MGRSRPHAGLKHYQDNLKNQQEVVKNEVKVNVLNQPYGGFPWLDMPQYANKNWFNAHNFYGDLKDQILLQGQDSRLYQALVQERGYSDAVTGGSNSGLGNMFNYNGPMFWDGSLVHDNTVTADSIIAVLDREIKKLETNGVNQALLDLATVKMRSSFYDQINELYGFGKADMLASFALFDNNPARINTLETEFRKVTPELMQKTLREYLRPTNRTILTINPLAKS